MIQTGLKTVGNLQFMQLKKTCNLLFFYLEG